MEVMMNIETFHLHKLREEFLREPDGLTLDHFVAVMMRYLPAAEDRVVAVKDLVELFAQVDVNGDGTMEWDEFSAFCIEAGMAANMFKKRKEWKYVEYPDATHLTPHGLHSSRLRYSPRLAKLFVCEDRGKRARVLNLPPGHTISGGLSLYTYLDTTNEKHTAKNPYEKAGGQVLDVAFLDSLRTVCVACSDLSFIFFDSSALEVDDSTGPLAELHRRKKAAGMPPVGVIQRTHTSSSQRLLAWSDETGVMYSAGSDQYIHGWEVQAIPGGPVGSRGYSVADKHKLQRHTDMVTDMVVVPGTGPGLGMLCTSGMDGDVHMWDVKTQEHITVRHAHSKGIASLAYCKEASILVSAGFDLEMHAWDLASMGARPLFHLLGHKYPLVSVVALPGLEQVVSIDTEGVFKWWDCRRSSAVMDMERCTQTWTTTESAKMMKAFVPRSLAVVGPAPAVVAVGARMFFFEAVRTRPAMVPPVLALYNEQDMSIFTAAERDVKVWDGHTGELLRDFSEVADSEITDMVFDSRQRKFLLGTQSGAVNVYNCLNGALMKEFTKHSSEVSAVTFSAEDQVAISVSWDRQLTVHDEESADGELLRVVRNAHDGDILCVAFSHELSLVATGGTDCAVKVWDFQYLAIEGVCYGHEAEVVALSFVEPYGLLASADASGRVFVWTVRPEYPSHRCVATFINAPPRPMTPGAEEAEADSITTMCMHYDPHGGEEIAGGIMAGRQLLGIGNDLGEVWLWDLSPLIKALGFKGIREADMMKSKGNYNARRRIVRDGPGMLSEVEEDGSVMSSRSRASSLKPDGAAIIASGEVAAVAAARASAEAGAGAGAGRQHKPGQLTGNSGSSAATDHGFDPPQNQAAPDAEQQQQHVTFTVEADGDAGVEWESGWADGMAELDKQHDHLKHPEGEAKAGDAEAEGKDEGLKVGQEATSAAPPSRATEARSTEFMRQLSRQMSRFSMRSKSSRRALTAVNHRTTTNGRLVALVNAWKAHEGSCVNRVASVTNPQSLLTCSQDGTVRLWSLTGRSLGLLDSGNPAATVWSMPIDTETRLHNELHTATGVLGQVDERNAAEAETIGDRPEFLDLDARKARQEQMRKRATELAGQVVGEREGEEGAVVAASSRSRLIGQLFGQVTWQRTAAEIAIEVATSNAKEEQKASRGRKRRKKRGKKRRDTTEITLTQLAKMDEQDSEPEEEVPKLQRRGPALEDPDDWGPGSSNQSRKLYPCLHDEVHRLELKREKRLGVSSPHAVREVPVSAFLQQQLGDELEQAEAGADTATPETSEAVAPPLRGSASAPALSSRPPPLPGAAGEAAGVEVPLATPKSSSRSKPSTKSQGKGKSKKRRQLGKSSRQRRALSKLAKPVPKGESFDTRPEGEGMHHPATLERVGTLQSLLGQMDKLASESRKVKRGSRKRVRARKTMNKKMSSMGDLKRYPTRMLLLDAKTARQRNTAAGMADGMLGPPVSASLGGKGGTRPAMSAAAVYGGAGRAVTITAPVSMPIPASPIQIRKAYLRTGELHAADLETLTPADRLALLHEKYGRLEGDFDVNDAGSFTLASKAAVMRRQRKARMNRRRQGSLSMDELQEQVVAKLEDEQEQIKANRMRRRSSLAREMARRMSDFQPPNKFDPDSTEGLQLPPVPGASKPEDSGDEEGGAPTQSKEEIAAEEAAAKAAEEEHMHYVLSLRKKRRFGHYSRREVQHIKTLFMRLDKDRSGTIDMHEFRSDPEVAGNGHLLSHMESMFASIDKDNSGEISVEEMVPILFPKATPSDVKDICTMIKDDGTELGLGKTDGKPKLSKEILEDLKLLFKLYDTDKSGGVSLKELESAFKRTEALYGKQGAARMSGRMGNSELQQIIGLVDVDKNLELDFDEFVELLGDTFT